MEQGWDVNLCQEKNRSFWNQATLPPPWQPRWNSLWRRPQPGRQSNLGFSQLSSRCNETLLSFIRICVMSFLWMKVPLVSHPHESSPFLELILQTNCHYDCQDSMQIGAAFGGVSKNQDGKLDPLGISVNSNVSRNSMMKTSFRSNVIFKQKNLLIYRAWMPLVRPSFALRSSLPHWSASSTFQGCLSILGLLSDFQFQPSKYASLGSSRIAWDLNVFIHVYAVFEGWEGYSKAES